MPERKVELHEGLGGTAPNFGPKCFATGFAPRFAACFAPCVAFLTWGIASCNGEQGSFAPSDDQRPVPAFAPSNPLQASTTGTQRVEQGERPTPPHHDEPKGLESFRKHAGIEQPRSQNVACGELGFVRLLPMGFEGYRYFDLSLTFRSNKRNFSHIVSQAGHSYLLVGASESLTYYQPNTHLQVRARLPALGAFQVWPDVRRHDWVWVHYLRDDAVHRFELEAPREAGTENVVGKQEAPKARLLQSVELLGFDGKSVDRAKNGTWLYTRGQEPEVLLMASFGKAGVAKVGETHVSLLTDVQRPNEPVVVALDGYPFSLVGSDSRVGSADRVGLVTHRLRAPRREWQLEVVDTSGRVRRVPLAGQGTSENPATDDAFTAEVANRSLCLVPGKPWAVVGGKTALRVVDYHTGKTLLER